MDTKKLYRALLDDNDIKDIPIIFVIRVAYAVLKIINEGNCFYETGVNYD